MKNRNFTWIIIFSCLVCVLGFAACEGCGEDEDDDKEENKVEDNDDMNPGPDDDSMDDDDSQEEFCDLEIDVCEWVTSYGCTDVTIDLAGCLNTFAKVEAKCLDWEAALNCFCDCREQGLTCKDYLVCVEAGCMLNHCV